VSRGLGAAAFFQVSPRSGIGSPHW